MGNMIRFDPFVDTFPDVFRNWVAPMRNNELAFDFKVDVSETDHEYKVKADIPGLKKKTSMSISTATSYRSAPKPSAKPKIKAKNGCVPSGTMERCNVHSRWARMSILLLRKQNMTKVF